jgi:Zn-dependent protease with chaperone function
MKRILFLSLFIVINCALIFSQSMGSTMYVAVKTTELKSDAGAFANSLNVLNLGDAVTLIRIKGKWAEVRVNNSLSGWAVLSGLSSRRIIGSVPSVTAKEVSFAGKGFSAETELEYKKNGLDYAVVDVIETLTIPGNELQKFVEEGRLANGENPDDMLFRMGRFFMETETTPTPEDEYYLGRAVAANILAAYKPYTKNKALTLYLNRICQALVINSPRPVIYNGYHLMILDSPGYNAFASPGGHIFITRGLVEAAPSEDALAGIIAHELAHIILRHSISMIDDMKLDMELEEELNAMAQEAASYANRENKRIAAFRSSVNEFFALMVKSGYSQPQEFEADKAAVALLAATGYDPAGLAEILKVLSKVRRNNSGGFMSTHPAISERITNMEKEILPYRVTNTRSFRVSRFKVK